MGNFKKIEEQTLSRRRVLAMAGIASLGSLVAPFQIESQVPPFVAGLALDLGKKLFDAGIEYAKGKALEDVFKEPTLVDVHEWVNQAVTSIESKVAALDAKIDQQNMDRMTSELDSIQDHFEHYSELPANQRERNRILLDQCDDKCSELLPLSQKYEQAFFLSSAVLGYKMLTRYALYELDRSHGAGAEVHVTNLEKTVRSYFEWASGARAKLVGKLMPRYRIVCKHVDKGSLVTSPKTQCDIFRGEDLVLKTDVMTWSYMAAKSGEDGYPLKTFKAALADLRSSPNTKNDWRDYREVSRKSDEQLNGANECMQRMYLAATRRNCPTLMKPRLAGLEIPPKVQYKWSDSKEWHWQQLF